MLRLDQVQVQRGSFALEADITLARGQRLAVLGASGSGKSTLLSAIAGFDQPDRGTVAVDGRDVTHLPPGKRPLSVLFQDNNLFPHLSIFENVAIGMVPNLNLGAQDRTRVEQALESVGLQGFAGRKPADLSGGQQSRAALARLLVRSQPLALLDEPFSALDPGLRRALRSLLAELCGQAGLTLVMVTHDLRDAAELCDQIVILDAGKIVLSGETGALIADPPPALLPWT